MADSLTTILSLLPGLQPHELAQLSARVKGLASVTPTMPQKSADDSFEQMVLEAIMTTLHSRGLECAPPSVLYRSTAYKIFREKAAILRPYLQKLDRIRTRALLLLAIDLLYDTLLFMPVPIGARMLMVNVHRIPEVMERHFPGYAAAGMLKMIVRASNGAGTDRRAD